MDKEIEKILDEIGMKIHLKGYKYWVEAVKMKINNPNMRITHVYTEIAQKYNETYSRVERALRHAWKSNKEFVEKRLGYKYQINNSIMLIYLLKKMEEK